MIAIYLQNPIPCFQPTDAQFGRLASLLGGQPALRLCRGEAEFLAALPAASAAVVWSFRQEWFALAPGLRAVFTPAAGRDYFKVSPPPGVTLHYGAFHGAIMGETALACLLAASHGLLQFSHAMRLPDSAAPSPSCRRGPSDSAPYPRLAAAATARRLAGATVLVLGFGAIGRAFARMAAPFGPRVIGVTRLPHPELAAAFPSATLATIDSLDTLLPAADHVVSFLPSGPATDDIIDARRLSLMKPSAFLYNFGRGNAIDEAALDAALRAGRLAGAVLDVFKEEPLPPASPLRTAPNCWLYPHSSAFSPDYLDLYFASVAPALAAFARHDHV